MHCYVILVTFDNIFLEEDIYHNICFVEGEEKKKENILYKNSLK